MQFADFSLDRFLALHGDQLDRYVEQFVGTRDFQLTPAESARLIDAMSQLDEVHLVYALELGVPSGSPKFADQAIDLLASEQAAVCVAAYRALDRISEKHLTDQQKVRIATTPIIPLFSNDLQSCRVHQIGTNEVFVSRLNEKFISKQIAHEE